jgi:hypothetical protein
MVRAPDVIDPAQKETEMTAGSVKQRWLLPSLLGMVSLVTLLHFVLPPSNFFLHNVLQRLYYIPIVWAAYSISRRSAVGIALLSSLTYLPHIFMAWSSHPAYQSAQVIEVVLFPTVGFAASWLFERQAAMRQTTLGYARMAQFGSVARAVIRSLKAPVKSLHGVLISLDTVVGNQPGAREFIRVMRSQIESIASVRDDMIRLVERKQVRLELADLNKIGQDISNQVSPLLRQLGITVHKRFAKDPIVCRIAERELP